MSAAAMVLLKGVRKHFRGFSLELDLRIERGSLCSILGPSGSGKTTILRTISGFERIEAGRILIEGIEVTRLPPARRRVGFVFQDPTLFPHLDVAGNVAYGLRVRGASMRERGEIVQGLLALMDLRGYESRRVQTLSGGERQRVAMARALAVQPRLLLLDEPFSSIDAPLRRELQGLLERLRRELGVTLLFVTHDQEEALSISDRVVVLRAGRIVQQDDPVSLYQRPRTAFAASFVGAANLFTGVVFEGGDPSLRVEGIRPFMIAPPADPRERPRTGSTITFLVRPEHLRFLEKAGAASPARLENSFPARIISRRYFTQYFQYICGKDGRQWTIFDAREREPGEEVMLCFDPEDAVILQG